MSDPVVSTTNGPVRGRTEEGCSAFLAVPFAAPPTGDLRWAPPVPPSPWTEPRDASRRGPAAWQPVGGPLDGLVPGMGSADQGEDCLHLNVWTPAPDGAGRPVMVWIHGGAYTIGSAALPVYDGARLAAATDTVVVSLNYRVGALGFLLLDDPEATANVGLLDQVAGLRWVRDDIAAFGGDPDNVTIFGESAGAGCVLSLLAMPAARGLFHRAIAQSGATDLLLDREGATEVATTFARCAGVQPGDLEALRGLGPDAVIAAQTETAGALFATVGMMPFHPCVDGDVLPWTWQEAAERGVSDVPLVIGTTRDEMSLFASFDPAARTLDADGLRGRLAATTEDVDAVVDAYAATGTTKPPEVWARVSTDRAMWIPSVRLAEAYAAHSPTWAYRFDWPAAPEGMGAPHAVDIPFAFGTIDVDGWDDFLADPVGAQVLSAAIQRLWSTFARDGSPAAEVPEWAPYDSERRTTLILDREISVVEDPNRPVREVWTAPTPSPA